MAIDEAAYLAAYRNPNLDKQWRRAEAKDAARVHIDELELEGVTVHKGDCVTVDHWLAGRKRDSGKFQDAWHEGGRRSLNITVLVWTEAGGFRAVPARMVHPCVASSGAAR